MSAGGADFIALLRERGIVNSGEKGAGLGLRPMPWWLMLLQGLAAWVASLMIILAVMSTMGGLDLTTLVRGAVGALLCATAIWLFRRERLFSEQMALAFSLAGQGLLVWAVADHWHLRFDDYRQVAAVGAVLSAAMLTVRASRLHRIVCALMLIFELGVMIGAGLGAEIYGMALTAGVMCAGVTRKRWAAHSVGRCLGPVAFAAGLSALALPAILGLARSQMGSDVLDSHSSLGQDMNGLAMGAAALLLAVAAYLLRTAPLRLRWSVVATALLWGAVFQAAPGLIVAMGVFVVAFHASQRTLGAFALLAGVLYIGEFYYLLDISLLHKSGLLALSGLALLALRGCLPWVEQWTRSGVES